MECSTVVSAGKTFYKHLNISHLPSTRSGRNATRAGPWLSVRATRGGKYLIHNELRKNAPWKNQRAFLLNRLIISKLPPRPRLELRLKVRYGFEFEQVQGVLAVNEGLYRRIFAHAGADVAVQNRIGEAQIVFVGFAGEAV